MFRCRHYDECEARLGYVGDDDARVIIGSHALIAALDSAAGSTGLLVIDEPPYLLETTALTLEDIVHTEAMLTAFDRQYADSLRPALVAVRTWIENFDESTRCMVVQEAVRSFSGMVEQSLLLRAQLVSGTGGDAVECATNAPMKDSRSQAPPVRQVELSQAKKSIERARQIGRASGVLRTLHYALTTPWRVVGRMEEAAGQTVLAITAAKRDFTDALRRDGAVVVMDANIDVNVDVYEKALAYTPQVRHFRAADGAEIERTFLWCSSASRTHWMRNGKLLAKPSLKNAFREIFKWLAAHPTSRKMGLITMKPIRLAVEAVLNPDDRGALDAWKSAGQLEGTLTKMREWLAPMIANWGGTIVVGHYGAVRGLNSMADMDCLVTLGDPWPNIGQVARDMDYLGMPEHGEARMEALCRAELEQAHGRLRVVHRKRPGRALHVGRVLPSGTGWGDGGVVRQEMTKGRPKKESVMSLEELEGIISARGGLKPAARQIGCSQAYLQKCRRGIRPISKKIADALRGLGDTQNAI